MKPVFVFGIAAIAAIAVALIVRAELTPSQPSAVSAPGNVVVVPPPARIPAADSTATLDSTPPARVPPAAGDDLAVSEPPKPTVVPVAPTPAAETPPEQAQDAAALLKRAAAAYGSVKSMKADFTQSQENPLLGRRTSSRGTVYQRRPDRFLMKFSQPAGDVIVSDGEYFWMYYPSNDAKQVMRSRAAQAGGLDLLAQFVGDPTRRFTWTDHGAETVGGRATRVLTLVPRENAGYKSLKVWVDTRDFLVRRFELTTMNGVIQHFDLQNLETNVELGDA